MSYSFLPDLIADIKAALPHLGITKRSKKLTFDGTNALDTAALMYQLLNAMPPGVSENIHKRYIDHVGKFHSTAFNVELQTALVKSFQRRTLSASELYLNDSVKSPLSQLIFIQNVYDIKRSFIYDKPEDRCYKYDYDYIHRTLNGALGDGLQDWLANHTEHCQVAYVPNQKERIFRSAEDDHKTFNYWDEPTWSRGWTPDPGAECPEEVADYLNHLVADNRSRYALACWIRDCIFDRADPILILQGTAGAGKTIFADSFLASFFVRKDYHMCPSTNLGDDRFQNELSDCRLFHAEEVNVDDDGREFLKRIHNGRTAIRRKFKDVEAPEKLWCSIVLTMNPKNKSKKVRLEYSDRKFFVPNLNPKPLKDTWGEENIKAFLEKLNDVEFLQQTASYFYHNFPAGRAKDFPKTEAFKQMCIDAYDYTFRRFVAMCRREEEIHSREFKKHFHRPVDVSDLIDSIKHYEDNFGEELAEVEHLDNGQWIAHSKIYRPEGYKNGSGKHHEPDDTQGLELPV